MTFIIFFTNNTTIEEHCQVNKVEWITGVDEWPKGTSEVGLESGDTFLHLTFLTALWPFLSSERNILKWSVGTFWE